MQDYKFEPNHQGQQQAMNEEADDKPSLSKTIGNVMNLLNDGLYRMKNRTKSELVVQRHFV